MAADRDMTESSRAVYLYCVVDSTGRLTAARSPSGIPGGTRPHPVPLGGTLWMIVSEAPPNQYGEDALQAKLRSLEWVSEVAVAHEAVVEHFTRRRGTTVIPMKLLTLFSSEEGARAGLRARRREITAAIRRIAGCEEWGVRVFARTANAAAAGNSRKRSGGQSMSGTAFLAARKAAREEEQSARAAAVEAAGAAFDELARVARAARQRPRTAEPGVNPPLLDAAFLVTAASRTAFRAAARRQAHACAAVGGQMTLSGPWPAYNFVGDTGETT